MALGLGTSEAANGDAKRILVLYPYTETLPSIRETQEAIQRTLAGSATLVQVYSDHLDLSKFESAAYGDDLTKFLAKKYRGIPFDVVVGLSPAVIRLLDEHHATIAPGAKVLVAGVSSQTLDAMHLRSEMFAVTSDYNVRKTVELASALQPDARTLIVISGDTQNDKSMLQAVSSDLARIATSHAIEYWTDIPFEQMRSRAADLPRESMILFLAFTRDVSGRAFTVPRDAMTEIARNASVPVYVLFNTSIGFGALGGNTDTFDDLGTIIGTTALDIVADPKSARRRTIVPTAFRVDARELARWSIPRERLPAGTIVLFDKPSLWAAHSNAIVALAAILLAQTLLVGYLIVQRRRRRQAELRLKDSEARMAMAATSADVGLWSVDLGSGRLWATDHCRAMFNLDRSAPLTPQSLLPAIHPDDRRTVERAMMRIAQGESFNGEFRILSGGATRWVKARGDVGTNELTGERRVSGIFKDITEQKESQASAEEQRREVVHMSRHLVLGELSGALAHELNQPLASILANAQAAEVMLESDAPNVAEALTALHEIVEADARASQVIRRLRTMLKKETAAWIDMDINELIMSTCALLASQVLTRRIALRTVLEPNLPRAHGDQIQIQQVVLNLLMNAVESIDSRPGGARTITVRTRTWPTSAVAITVEDSGPGIAADGGEQLFQPFFTTKPGGLGLGLSICNSIVANHGGSLMLSNSASGGAVATVTIPIRLALEAAE